MQGQKGVKKKKWWIGVVLMLIPIFVFLSLRPVLLRRSRQAIGQTNKTIVVETGDIVKNVVGTGTLKEAGRTDITAPAGVKIEKVLIEAGDLVFEGQPMASLEAKSLEQGILTLRAELLQLDASLSRMSNRRIEAVLKSPVDGRVKQVMAAVGEDVAARMNEQGALLMLSVDGRMAMGFIPNEAQELRPRGVVKVLLSDGSEKTGRIESLSASGTWCIVSIDDNGPILGDLVKVFTEDGETQLGEGILYIHKPLPIIAVGGTIGTIHVKENTKVSRNASLITLKDLPFSHEYETLYATRIEKGEALGMLLALLDYPHIISTQAGVVHQVTMQNGEAVMVEKTIANLMMGATHLIVSVDELDVLSISTGQQATVVLDAIPLKTYDAVIEKVSYTGSASGGITQYAVTLSIIGDDSLRVGMNATASILVERRENVVLLPMEALQELNGETFVWVSGGEDTSNAEPGTKRIVSTGLSDGRDVEIIDGLKAGEQVVYVVRGSSQNGMFGFPFGGRAGSAPRN